MEKFESSMASLSELNDELETLLYSVGDAPVPPTEDELMNMIIGIQALHKVRYSRMWADWNMFCKINKVGEYELEDEDNN